MQFLTLVNNSWFRKPLIVEQEIECESQNLWFMQDFYCWVNFLFHALARGSTVTETHFTLQTNSTLTYLLKS